MSLIYVPSGKAREYSPLAINLYSGCNHACKYCYAPPIRRILREEYLKIVPRRNVLQEVEKEAKNHYNTDEQILFCFMTDPYNSLEQELRITRESLKIMLKHKIPVSVLSKAGDKVLNDIDVIKKFGKHIQVGATLTFENKKDSFEWEPGAACPDNRIKTLKTLKENGIKTWASFEPVVDPAQSFSLIEKTVDIVDVYKIGKLNNFNGIDKTIDWTAFLSKVVNFLRISGKKFYIKHDLRLAAPSVRLYGNEVNMDEFNLPAFDK